MSLRRAFLGFAVALVLMGILGGGGLILLTTILHRAIESLETAVESVRVASEFKIELLKHRETFDSLARVAGEGRMRQRLREAGLYVGTAREAALLARTRAGLDAYLAHYHRPSASDQPLQVLQELSEEEFETLTALARELIQVNVEQSRALRRRAAAWDRTGNIVGTAILMVLVTGLAALGLFLRRAVFAPTLSIAEAVERYAKGDRSARAPEDGAQELRGIARRFNAMASTIERQRGAQLAFLAGVAHDIRTPLAAMKLASAVVSAGAPLPSEERIRLSYARVQRQIDRLERMVFDFLDVTRIEAGQLRLALEACDVRDIARATLELFEPTAPTHRLTLSAPSDPVFARCDPMRIEQVLDNLVSNAIKYSPRGGPVRMSVEPRDGLVVISVEDAGVGMSPAEIEQLFEPFHRAGASQESVPGVGLGLFVARSIVELHGGRITVESAPERGSTFRVQLPARTYAATGEPPATSAG